MVDVQPPHRAPRDQLEVRLRPAEEIEHWAWGRRNESKAREQPPPEAGQVEIVPLDYPRLATLAPNALDLFLRETTPVKPGRQAGGERQVRRWHVVPAHP